MCAYLDTWEPQVDVEEHESLVDSHDVGVVGSISPIGAKNCQLLACVSVDGCVREVGGCGAKLRFIYDCIVRRRRRQL